MTTTAARRNRTRLIAHSGGRSPFFATQHFYFATQQRGRMKLATWNVNSIRARLERVLGWLDERQPDVLCMQELKVEEKDFPLDAFRERGWHVAHACQKTYNSVAI